MDDLPIIVVTGAAGRIGRLLTERLRARYRVLGLARSIDADTFACDIADRDSVIGALAAIRAEHGAELAAVLHLAAYYDFSGNDDPRYTTVNVEGTRNLVAALQGLTVGRFIYASTMLVHEPVEAGHRVNEETPIGPRWAYPRSKAAAEAAIAETAGDMPYSLLRIAGVYDERAVIPTLAQQIARIYERDFESKIFAGQSGAGQSLIHTEDMLEAIELVVEKRDILPRQHALLLGEPGAASYFELQQRIGRLIHGEHGWQTLALPPRIAHLGATIQHLAEPLIPNSIDQGERPFIQPFMIALASDHYGLDVRRAKIELGFEPKHRILDELPGMIARLKSDPIRWYRNNNIRPSQWMNQALAKGKLPETVRLGHEVHVQRQHRRWIWAHWVNVVLGLWLCASPVVLAHGNRGLGIVELICGALLFGCGVASLNWWLSLARFGAAVVGFITICAPLIFWTDNAAAFLSDTALGALAMVMALVALPFPLVSRIATETGPDVPPGWTSSPSTMLQRSPTVVLAGLGFFVSAYLTAYQLGLLDRVWDPFFPNALGRLNGTEAIIGSEVWRSWPIPAAGAGEIACLLAVVNGLVGGPNRWRANPWVVIIFGLLIVPLGLFSIIFVVLQPILLHTWCSVCLLLAAAMVVQIPFSLDELVATGQFIRRRYRTMSFVRAVIFGDTDDGERRDRDDLSKPLPELLRRIFAGVSLPWTLALSIVIGLVLMTERLTLGAEDLVADTSHLVGALVIVVAVMSSAEVARPLRFLNILNGLAAAILPLLLGGTTTEIAAGVGLGLALIPLSIPRGKIAGRYGTWNKLLI